MSNTLGIHWIVTTFGTWLHGDPRGSWRHGKLIGPDPFLEQTIKNRMTADAVVLDRTEAIAVATAFGDAINESGWRVHAATVQPTHAHIVFGPIHEPIDNVIAMLKYRSATQVLTVRRNRGLAVGRSLWTEGQYPVFIFDEDHLHNAIAYVRNHNRRRGKPADPYPWVRPLD